LDVDEQTYVAEVTLVNSRPDYEFGSYALAVPDSYGGEKLSVMLLRPNETLRIYQGLNHSLFDNGFLYTVPVSASFNDAHDDETLSVGRFAMDDESRGESSGGCSTALIMGLLALAAMAAWYGIR
jgi:hypothetical protein